MTSGSVNDPPLMVRVAVQLMNGLTPSRVYTSGVGPVAAPCDEAAPARPAVMAPVVCNKPRRLMPGRARVEGLCMYRLPCENNSTATRTIGYDVPMRRSAYLAILPLLLTAASAQQYDIVLHGGRVIDPGNGVDAQLDIGLTDGRIAAVQAAIPRAQARKIIDVSGLYVVPGLVDLHTHVFGYAGALSPDDTAL